ncbi:MAG TPA: type II secretion system minor pseudopilin GspI [Gammaproteobacteria bacterium]|nr:type II secretion system minor pseudopilin GspI [Gammaproteobacteria bacterium]
MHRSRQSGFTLMEVLIALAILGIGMLAVISTTGTSTRTALDLKQRTFAHWVAMNEAARLRASPAWPDTGHQNGTEDMAGQTWRWTADISKTVDPDLRRADITVALDDAPDTEVASLIVFIGKPSAAGFGGKQLAGPSDGEKR